MDAPIGAKDTRKVKGRVDGHVWSAVEEVPHCNRGWSVFGRRRRLRGGAGAPNARGSVRRDRPGKACYLRWLHDCAFFVAVNVPVVVSRSRCRYVCALLCFAGSRFIFGSPFDSLLGEVLTSVWG